MLITFTFLHRGSTISSAATESSRNIARSDPKRTKIDQDAGLQEIFGTHWQAALGTIDRAHEQ